MTLLVTGVIAIALALALVILVLTLGSRPTTGVARSLELVSYRPTSSHVSQDELPARDRLLLPLLEGTKDIGERLSPAGAAERLARSLDRAGNPAPWTPDRIMGAKGLGLLIGAAVALFAGGLTIRGILFAVGAAAIGFFLPDLLVYNVALRRQEQLRKGFADALDMLTVCVEAGQGFDAAIRQVAQTVPGPIGGELARVLSEIQIGKSRADAFSDLGERAVVDEVKSFVSALVQADRMGIPIAAVLREQTREMRLTRRQRAEEQAQKVTVKILFPLLFCIFPMIFVVIIGPGIIRIVDAFAGF